MLKGKSSKKRKKDSSELEDYLAKTAYHEEPILEPIVDSQEEPILQPFYQEEPTIESIIATYEEEIATYETDNNNQELKEKTHKEKYIAKEYLKPEDSKAEEQKNETDFKDNNHEDTISAYEEYEKIEKEKTQYKRNKKIINIVFVIILLIMTAITVDVICVARYNKGPFFAIKINTLKDGGTKIYYGFGYKVIKYHQKQGRRDTKIGLWTMPYSTNPTTISSLDLAIEFRNNPEKTSRKYYKNFLRINGTVKKVDKKKITMEYKDPDQKYTLQIICPIAEKNADLSFKKNQEITVIGTVQKFTIRTTKKPNMLYMSDCFAEKGTAND